jgi:lysophospholipase
MTEPNPRRTHPQGATFSTWTAPDGWPIRRMHWPRAAGAPVCGKLFFANGRGDFIEKYLECYAWWHQAGWDVTAFDWRNQGLSQREPLVRCTSFDPMIDDLAALIADWRNGDSGPHVAIGHSMGGHLLLRTIADRRPALDAAVLVAPMLLVNSAPIPLWMAPQFTDLMCLTGWRDQPIWRAPIKPAPAGSPRQHVLTGSVERYADELWWWEQQPALKGRIPTWGWMRAAYRSAASVFTPQKLGAVETPILILGAEQDRLVSAAAIRRAAALLPNARLKMYPDSAHEILREADPVRLDALREIDAFFAEHARRPFSA